MYDGEIFLNVGASVLPLSSVIALEEARSGSGGDNDSPPPSSNLNS